jgi:dTDP-4-dehydrorhamnose reductase
MLMEKRYYKLPEIWGGIECSLNRVKGKFFDQLDYCGHYSRAKDDIDLFAELGITAIRYPVLLEKLQPKFQKPIDWSFVDVSLNALKERNITVIAGLMHHGSGPKYADLCSAAFPTVLEEFATKVAERFPWLEYYNPVNEPLTNARFCGLYGLWYPHKKNDKAFVTTLLNQLKGVVLSMKAIRKINPAAKLVQTEDLAKIYSTPFMKYQADFENHRRWLTFDILCGMLKPGHPLWPYFKKYSQSESDLYFFVENPLPPDIMGLDYYPTSERFLDEDLEKYPPYTHGHNHRHRYADVEALRVNHGQPSGIRLLLNEAWTRYRLPMAITEVHINCDVDNQIRWFSEIRDTCIALITQGVDIRAVTTWAMLGSYGWNRLLTLPKGDYECGAFDVSSGYPILTQLGEYIQQVIKDPVFDHAALAEKGWWHQADRFFVREEVLVSSESVNLKEDCIQR